MSSNIVSLEAKVWVSGTAKTEPWINKAAEVTVSQAIRTGSAILLAPTITLTAGGYSKAVVFSYADRITRPSVQVRPCRV